MRSYVQKINYIWDKLHKAWPGDNTTKMEIYHYLLDGWNGSHYLTGQ